MLRVHKTTSKSLVDRPAFPRPPGATLQPDLRACDVRSFLEPNALGREAGGAVRGGEQCFVCFLSSKTSCVCLCFVFLFVSIINYTRRSVEVLKSFFGRFFNESKFHILFEQGIWTQNMIFSEGYS